MSAAIACKSFAGKALVKATPTSRVARSARVVVRAEKDQVRTVRMPWKAMDGAVIGWTAWTGEKTWASKFFANFVVMNGPSAPGVALPALALLHRHSCDVISLVSERRRRVPVDEVGHVTFQTIRERVSQIWWLFRSRAVGNGASWPFGRAWAGRAHAIA